VIRVGLTGAVASGKSTVAWMLAELGARVRDADRVVADLYGPQAAGATAVSRHFGPELLDHNGAVDRSALAKLVLGDAESRRRLEDLIHPLVRRELDRWFAELEFGANEPAVAVVEAALLVETGEYRRYHRLVVVEAPLEIRRLRALGAGWEAERFDAVDEVQAGEGCRRAVADYLVANTGCPEDLERKVRSLWKRLSRDCEDLAAGRGLARPKKPLVRP